MQTRALVLWILTKIAFLQNTARRVWWHSEDFENLPHILKNSVMWMKQAKKDGLSKETLVLRRKLLTFQKISLMVLRLTG